jgi:hypothetical protein
LSKEEFMALPDLGQNPLVERVIAIFDSDGDGEIDFEGTVPPASVGLFSAARCGVVWCGEVTSERREREGRQRVLPTFSDFFLRSSLSGLGFFSVLPSL